ncbi:unnamed protein product, partial [Nesidiocoris tenuis]
MSVVIDYVSEPTDVGLPSARSQDKDEFITWPNLLRNGYVMALIIFLGAMLQGSFSQASTHIISVEGIRLKTALQIFLLMYLLYRKLGVSAIVGATCCIAIVTPLQFYIGKKMSNNSKAISVSTRRLNEFLHLPETSSYSIPEQLTRMSSLENHTAYSAGGKRNLLNDIYEEDDDCKENDDFKVSHGQTGGTNVCILRKAKFTWDLKEPSEKPFLCIDNLDIPRVDPDWCGTQSSDDRQYGTIPSEIYMAYLEAAGILASLAFLCLAVGWQGFRVYTDFWLSDWTQSSADIDEDQ